MLSRSETIQNQTIQDALTYNTSLEPLAGSLRYSKIRSQNFRSRISVTYPMHWQAVAYFWLGINHENRLIVNSI